MQQLPPSSGTEKKGGELVSIRGSQRIVTKCHNPENFATTGQDGAHDGPRLGVSGIIGRAQRSSFLRDYPPDPGHISPVKQIVKDGKILDREAFAKIVAARRKR